MHQPTFTGRHKLAVSQRLGANWHDLADYCDLPLTDRDRFAPGREPQEVWEWLERHERLGALPEALRYIGRTDIVVDILEPPPAPPTIAWQGAPFPGLRHFTIHDAPIFFGRTQETDDLLARIQQERFVAVVGASGSGKSSLVAAGVLARLHARPQEERWPWLRFTPGGLGDNPFLALGAELAHGLEPHGLNGGAIAKKLRDNSDLATLAEMFLAGYPASAELLLFIDQFEELFTLSHPDYRQRFMDMLARAAQASRLRVLLTLRADFYHRCVEHAPLAALLRRGSFPLAAPDLPALLEMITSPASVVGLAFADGLPSRLLRETGQEPGALALLAFALAELYERCQAGKILTQAAYEQFGGVQGAIARRADDTYTALAPEAQQALGEVFTELVEVEPEHGIPTRKRAPLARVAGSEAAGELIEAFVRARLLVRGGQEQPLVEVAHEALLTNWARLRDWITARFDDLRLLRRVRSEAAEWRRQGFPLAHLWRHEQLEPVAAMLRRLQPVLEEWEEAFVRPEAEQLLAEIAYPDTSHQRRAFIGDRLAEIGDPRPGVGVNREGAPDIVWLPVPGGEVVIEGTTFTVEPFAISKYLATWEQYRCFLDAANGYARQAWWRGLAERKEGPGEQFRQQDNHPAENVSWYDAVAFCRWLRERLGYEVRLPTEWEWQLAATGGKPNYVYPWGEEWHAAYANTWESRLNRTTAVGLYPQGASSVGALDMSGNVWEWCVNEYLYNYKMRLYGMASRVLRGGAWFNSQFSARASYRNSYGAHANRGNGIGLRVVRPSPILP